MTMTGRESLPQGAADEELLLEAETLAGAAMRSDAGKPVEGD
jgi:ATP-dependent helicase Lhr and Lhr-like helicase